MNDYLIYYVEDDNEISDLIKLALTKYDFFVETFPDGETFLETFETKKPNLVLLDLMLPGIQGNEVLKKIRENKENDDIPVIILSARSLIDDKVIGLNNGADDYIVKPFNIKELISRINVHYRKHLRNSFIIKDHEYLLNLKDKEFYKFDTKVNLTSTELQIIEYLLLNKGRVVSRNELLNELNLGENPSNTRVLDMHIKSIREKINDKDRKYIISIYGEGYKIK